MSTIGYCPVCRAPGRLRERRPNGNDVCQNNHTYPSRDAVDEPGVITDAERWAYVRDHVMRIHIAADPRVGTWFNFQRLTYNGSTPEEAIDNAIRGLNER